MNLQRSEADVTTNNSSSRFTRLRTSRFVASVQSAAAFGIRLSSLIRSEALQPALFSSALTIDMSGAGRGRAEIIERLSSTKSLATHFFEISSLTLAILSDG